MDKTVKIFTVFIVILCTAVFFTGCTSNSGAANVTTPVSTQSTTIAAAGAIYVAGDIVKSPSGSASNAWLILSYDSATDTYSRALIYQNSDGTWGYRVNTNTETSARKVMEKVYTDKVTHVTVSSVPVKTATTASTSAPTVTSTTTVSGTTSATTSATTTPTGKPQFKSMVPDSADAGTQVSITDLTGSNFQTGATVMLARTGSSNITATNVQVVSASHMTCTFAIPSTAATGSWNIIITNPDSQSVTYSNYFTIHASTSVTTTTTTSPTGTVVITRIEPTFVYLGGNGWLGPITIYTTTNIQIDATAKLVNSGGQVIAGTSGPISDTLNSIPVRFNIPVGSQGHWNVVLTNPDGTNGTLTNGLAVY